MSRASMHRTKQWQSLIGETIEVWLDQRLFRRGVVDDVMPDASGLWMARDWPSQREFIDAASGFAVGRVFILAQTLIRWQQHSRTANDFLIEDGAVVATSRPT